jgi:hypothetical protein
MSDLIRSPVVRDGAICTVEMVVNPIARLFDPELPAGSRTMNFDPGTQDGEALLELTEDPTTREPSQHGTLPFMVQWWCAKAVDLPSIETGEIKRAIRLTLISDDFDTLAFTSIGAVQSWDLIRLGRGDGPYDPAMPIWVRNVRTQHGRTMYQLRRSAPLTTAAT